MVERARARANCGRRTYTAERRLPSREDTAIGVRLPSREDTAIGVSRRRRGDDVDIPRSRGDAAATTARDVDPPSELSARRPAAAPRPRPPPTAGPRQKFIDVVEGFGPKTQVTARRRAPERPDSAPAIDKPKLSRKQMDYGYGIPRWSPYVNTGVPRPERSVDRRPGVKSASRGRLSLTPTPRKSSKDGLFDESSGRRRRRSASPRAPRTASMASSRSTTI